jgi:anthranilate phosphoribosyltransferase
MKNVAPVRKELGMKTFFNMLGPLVNPSFPSRQLVGVYSLELSRLYNYLYQAGDKEYVILHSLDGYDEVSLTGPCKVITRTMDRIIQPADLQLPSYLAGQLSGGGSAAGAMQIFMAVLQNKSTDAQRDVVIANAGLALQACYTEQSLEDCLGMARQSIESGSALKAFNTLMEMNK